MRGEEGRGKKSEKGGKKESERRKQAGNQKVLLSGTTKSSALGLVGEWASSRCSDGG